ncbi:MAG: DNA polymerase III subunit epsilon [Betaproteobacteria bacterium]|nr:DNA polymerase III subunit epsilon [Betaproteobacteria bacterium]MDE2131653.1 DNA polymerase III subunit epsilon [Betaproteobacteria bacterium]MDE2211166.1 DNA polymerase III subunit epsilon [Betaproteobacteria bacterium]
MRYVVLDTETTGLEPTKGHRVIEIGLVEIVHRRRTGAHFHQYLNPDRDSDPGALQKHGLTTEFLSDKPRFAEVVDPFLEFVQGAQLVIHNAAFDLGFLDHELRQIGREPLSRLCPQVTDTLTMARELHPGKRNTLDALCERYGVDNSRRTFHGALLDAELLGDVYLAMTRGQETLLVETATATAAESRQMVHRSSKPLVVRYATLEELDSHLAQLEKIDQASKGRCLWKRSVS